MSVHINADFELPMVVLPDGSRSYAYYKNWIEKFIGHELPIAFYPRRVMTFLKKFDNDYDFGRVLDRKLFGQFKVYLYMQ